MLMEHPNSAFQCQPKDNSSNLAYDASEIDGCGGGCHTRVAIRAVGKVMEIFGGSGCIREYPIQRLNRDVKSIEFGAGTSQVQRMIIVEESVIRCRSVYSLERRHFENAQI